MKGQEGPPGFGLPRQWRCEDPFLTQAARRRKFGVSGEGAWGRPQRGNGELSSRCRLPSFLSAHDEWAGEDRRLELIKICR